MHSFQRFWNRNRNNLQLFGLCTIVGSIILCAIICCRIWYRVEPQLTRAHEFDMQELSQFNMSAIWPPLECSPLAHTDLRTLWDILKDWNPDNPDPPSTFRETIQHFNYSDPEQRKLAEIFRNAEVPFKLYDIPEVDYVVNRWTDEYLMANIDSVTPHIESSTSNHFMYWNLRGNVEESYKPPTTVVDMEYTDWLRIARSADKEKHNPIPQHFYFMIGTQKRSKSKNLVNEDLAMFATRKNNFFITDVNANKGIQCRFGMRGIIAEAHYDSGRNMIAMMRGHKRYVLVAPRYCKSLGIITDVNHPSYRHSVIDWSDLKQAQSSGFDQVYAIDTVLQTGELLYLPSYWFHYIVSLDYSIQCNSRSGTPPGRQGEEELKSCMGATGKKRKRSQD